MNISRSFIGIGILYLLTGMGFGMYMGGKADYTLAPLHAHINLVGFVLMCVFGLVYRQFPAMAENTLGRVHFWLYQIGAIVLVVMLYLYLSGRISEAGMVPLAPLAEAALWLGVAAFGVSFLRNGR
jgi:cbb3-type cytochrome oxidase subunit 1